MSVEAPRTKKARGLGKSRADAAELLVRDANGGQAATAAGVTSTLHAFCTRICFAQWVVTPERVFDQNEFQLAFGADAWQAIAILIVHYDDVHRLVCKPQSYAEGGVTTTRESSPM
eukprot:scaffold647938_cov45-Prasinocladus_malaysianus.AAC.1